MTEAASKYRGTAPAWSRAEGGNQPGASTAAPLKANAAPVPSPMSVNMLGLRRAIDAAIASIAWRPCSIALRINPIPPSSPAMKMPRTFDSKLGVTFGMSTPRFAEPNTSVIASTGQAALQAP